MLDRTRMAIAWLLLATGCTASAEPWTAITKETKTRAPHILLTYDMEGLSGQDDIASAEPEEVDAYRKGRQLLTDDVNAVIRGLFAGGAKSVTVLDGHGGGNRTIDVLQDQLDPRVELIKQVPFDAYADPVKPGAYDALVAVGMHPKNGSGGFWAHTYTYGIDIAFNGHSVSESEFLALAYGAADIPLIFVSGDDLLGKSLQPLSWIEYVAVKKSTGPDSATLYPVPEMHKALTAGAKRSVQRLSTAKVLKLSLPAEIRVSAIKPWDMSWLGRIPGVNYRDNGVTFTAQNFPDAYRGIKALSAGTVFNYYDVIEKAVHELPNAAAIELQLEREYKRMWLDAERSGLPR
ncbi:M55 family metallopeptidase [Steroidobacter sp.]|uniref:M55 family metallopeptidase n=1 Tax=Steroidobacter sp. TaxID=1978227 RepID=UPI001A449248|nr:M55 family metallopeptidase [Steroidobacter sp.]MBL8268493.1 M55 family metallopeptidase [Steroidobacter sp.]